MALTKNPGIDWHEGPAFLAGDRAFFEAQLAMRVGDLVRHGGEIGNEPTRGFVASLLDDTWMSTPEPRRIERLDEFYAIAEMVQAGEQASEAAERPLSKSILTSVAMLRFLTQDYLPHLQRRFSACMLTGSLSYGRFHSVKGEGDQAPSDIDLLVVAHDGSFGLEDLLLGDKVVDDLDVRSRFDAYLSDLRIHPTDLLNYRVHAIQAGFEISLTLCTREGFAHMLSSGGGETLQTRMRRVGSFNGAANLQFDFSGRRYDAPYVEERSANGDVILALPVISFGGAPDTPHLGRVNGFAALILPRFDLLFGDTDTKAVIRRFARLVAKLMTAYRAANLPAALCASHIRHQRFPAHLEAVSLLRLAELAA